MAPESKDQTTAVGSAHAETAPQRPVDPPAVLPAARQVRSIARRLANVADLAEDAG